MPVASKRQSTPAPARASKRLKDGTDITTNEDSIDCTVSQSADVSVGTSSTPESAHAGQNNANGPPREDRETPHEGLIVTADNFAVFCVKTAKLEEVFPGKPAAVARIHKLIRSAGVFPGATNLATVDPDLLRGRTGTHIVKSEKPVKPIVFTIYGVSTFITLDLKKTPTAYSKQFGFVPFHSRWDRSCATLRRCFGQKYLYTRSYRGGLIAQSSTDIEALPKRNDGGQDIHVSAGHIARKNPKQPFRSVMPKNWRIPLYDGRKPFSWREFEDLPMFDLEKAGEGMACAVLCTITANKTNAYTNEKVNKNNVKASLTFNLLGVVILEDMDMSRRPGAGIGAWASDLHDVQPDPSLEITECIDENGMEYDPTPEINPEQEDEVI